MSDLVARTGRLQQRYEAGCRLVAGCIPFRYRNSNETGDNNSEKVVEVLMINSPSGPGLLFPKGGWENDETVEEAAVREAVEEAGVRGNLMVKLYFSHLDKCIFSLNNKKLANYFISWLKSFDLDLCTPCVKLA
ncbi:hypothetical protein SLEP1_g5251 [Rubroshorea leprosula]|uniref:Nudix hydrolase domain-containing protein n=1 Tax=Rubroshorea leprosula TaxID=152421 RepID=A0AAV5HZ91_9ROSI|nr:hypothetical protein SLEP1_g5251 [Rubroshorea leprosula]